MAHGWQRRTMRGSRNPKRERLLREAADDRICPSCGTLAQAVRVYGLCEKCLRESGEWHRYFSA